MRILVIGGTLFIGKHLVEALLHAGHDVTVLHRNASASLPRGVRGLVADRNDPEAVSAALAGERFEAVFDNVYDWQRGTTAEQVAATARACDSGALERYVFMSSVAAFGDGLDRGDDDPLAPDDHPDAYVRNKARSERALFALKGFPAITLRPPFVYGPGNPFYREAFFWDRFREGRSVIVPGDGARLMHFVYVKDIVFACLRALASPRAVGRGFNIGNDKPVSQLELVRALAHPMRLETAPRIVFVPREKALAAGGHPMGPKLYFGMYYDLPPITMRIQAAHEILGFAPTSFLTGLQETYDWWLRNNLFPAPDYRFEDQLLSTDESHPA